MFEFLGTSLMSVLFLESPPRMGDVAVFKQRFGFPHHQVLGGARSDRRRCEDRGCNSDSEYTQEKDHNSEKIAQRRTVVETGNWSLRDSG